MINPDGTPNVSHTANKVPFLVIPPHSCSNTSLQSGCLADVAPTVLCILGLSKPAEMTGCCLIQDDNQIRADKLLLVILDGWGIGKEDDTNPIFLAQTPSWDGS
jgi:2,3-bisphosphoglycerate-independent phosphoglycerate mutase